MASLVSKLDSGYDDDGEIRTSTETPVNDDEDCTKVISGCSSEESENGSNLNTSAVSVKQDEIDVKQDVDITRVVELLLMVLELCTVKGSEINQSLCNKIQKKSKNLLPQIVRNADYNTSSKLSNKNAELQQVIKLREIEIKELQSEMEKLKVEAKSPPTQLEVVHEIPTDLKQQLEQCKTKIKAVENMNKEWQKYNWDMEQKTRAFMKQAQDHVARLDAENLSLKNRLKAVKVQNDQYNEKLSDLTQELQRANQRERQLNAEVEQMSKQNKDLSLQLERQVEQIEEAQTALVVATSRPSSDNQQTIYDKKVRQLEMQHQTEISQLRNVIFQMQRHQTPSMPNFEHSSLPSPYQSAPPRLTRYQDPMISDIEPDGFVKE